MTNLLRLLPFFGLLLAALLLAGVMMDARGYRWCDQYSNPQCASVTGTVAR